MRINYTHRDDWVNARVFPMFICIDSGASYASVHCTYTHIIYRSRNLFPNLYTLGLYMLIWEMLINHWRINLFCYSVIHWFIRKYIDRKSNLIILYTYDRTHRMRNYISGMEMMRSYVQYNMTKRLVLNIAKRLIFLLNVWMVQVILYRELLSNRSRSSHWIIFRTIKKLRWQYKTIYI